MKYKFTANTIAVEDDGGVVVVGFADDGESPSNYIMLQWDSKIEKSDNTDCQKELYIELNDQIQSVYGGLEKIHYSTDTIIFTFDEGASKKLRVDSVIEIEIKDQNLKISKAIDKISNIASRCNVIIEKI